jgi:hypothetical protein
MKAQNIPDHLVHFTSDNNEPDGIENATHNTLTKPNLCNVVINSTRSHCMIHLFFNQNTIFIDNYE